MGVVATLVPKATGLFSSFCCVEAHYFVKVPEHFVFNFERVSKLEPHCILYKMYGDRHNAKKKQYTWREKACTMQTFQFPKISLNSLVLGIAISFMHQALITV